MTQSKPKVVYVLVSNSEDHYTEMAMASIHCTRRYSPSTAVELVLDKQTFNNLKGFRATVIEMVDKINIVDLIGENNAYTSRMLKTQLRNIVDGDYLYVDIDALPVDDLNSIFDINADIAMSHDMNLPPEKFVFRPFEREIFDKTHWPLPSRYFNSGVMLVRDNQRTKDFFRTWHDLWTESSKLGLHKDQPAMHEALRRESMNVYALPPEYNVMLVLQKGTGAKNPIVYHYSTIRFDTRNDTHFHEIVKRLKREGKLDAELLETVIDSKYPWTNRHSIKLSLATSNYKMLPKVLINKLLSKFWNKNVD